MLRSKRRRTVDTEIGGNFLKDKEYPGVGALDRMWEHEQALRTDACLAGWMTTTLASMR
jgi:hypothetical protein